MGFKSKITPCLDVVRLDGQRCLGYVEKELVRKLECQRMSNPGEKLIFLPSQNIGDLFCVE